LSARNNSSLSFNINAVRRRSVIPFPALGPLLDALFRESRLPATPYSPLNHHQHVIEVSPKLPKFCASQIRRAQRVVFSGPPLLAPRSPIAESARQRTSQEEVNK